MLYGLVRGQTIKENYITWLPQLYKSLTKHDCSVIDRYLRQLYDRSWMLRGGFPSVVVSFTIHLGNGGRRILQNIFTFVKFGDGRKQAETPD